MKKVRIYFTHDVEDVELVNSLADILSFVGIFDVFVSPYSLPGTVPKLDEGKKAKIESCDLVVVVFTRRSLRMTLVKEEIDFATSRDKAIIPLLEQSVKIPKIGKIIQPYLEKNFYRTKLETAANHILNAVDILQTRLGISRDSIAKARMALKEYPKEQFKLRMPKTARLATFRRIVAEAMKNLGYSVWEQPLFFLARRGIRKELNLIATREGHRVNIACISRRIKLRDVQRIVKYAGKEVTESWIVTTEAAGFTKKAQDMASVRQVNLVLIENLLGELDPPTRETLLQRYAQLLNAQAVSIVNRKFYPELLASLRMVRTARTSAEKGRSLERLAECFVNLFSGLEVVGRNIRIEAEELDLVVKNEIEKIFWQRLGAPIIVECKNWTKPVGAPEIRDLVQKMREVRTAFLIAARGVTSRDGASYEIMEARKNTKFILVFDIGDMAEILRGTNPEEIVKDRFYSLWTKA